MWLGLRWRESQDADFMCCLLGVRKINVTKETTASPSAKLSILGLTESFAFGDQFSVVTWISDQMHIANETSFAFRKRRERIDWRKLGKNALTLLNLYIIY